MSPALGSRLLRRYLIAYFVLCAASLLRADDFWKSKPRSEWSLKQTIKLLKDSPWARQEVRTLLQSATAGEVAMDRSRAHCDTDARDASGDCLQTRYTVPKDSSASGSVEFSRGNDLIFLIRWESSAPIEDAFARLAELGERATAEYLSMPPRLPADRFVITLKALEKSAMVGSAPTAMPPDPIGPIENDAAGPRARLVVEKVTVAPLESERTGVGAAEAAHFYFPRQVDGAPLLPMDRASRVTFEFRGQRFSIKTHFSLTPDMLR
jgi:hypothetical protein